MVVRPALQPELALSLDVRVDKTTKSRHYDLTLTKAAQSIWQSMPENGGSGSPVVVDRFEVEIEADLARMILRIWRQMLILTRSESQSATIVLDSTDIEFSTVLDDGRRLIAQLPDDGGEKTDALAAIGYALVGYCEAPAIEKAKRVHDIRVRVEKLSRQLQRHGNP